MKRKLFVSFTGTLITIASGKTTADDLAKGLFILDVSGITYIIRVTQAIRATNENGSSQVTLILAWRRIVTSSKHCRKLSKKDV